MTEKASYPAAHTTAPGARTTPPEAPAASPGAATAGAPPHDRPPATDRRALRPVFASLMLAMLLAALDHTTVATALPTIVGELGDLGQLAWVIAAYMLAATVAAPVIGRASDQLGRKRVYMFAIGLFVFGALLSGSATSLGQLIAFRAVQGLGAGGTIALSQTVIADVVSARERGRYQALMGTVFAFASVVGPLLGGLFVDQVTWRLVFWMNVPLGIIALVVIHRRLHLPAATSSRRIDWAGAALLVVTVTSLLLALTWGGSVLPWTSPLLFGLVGGGVATLLVFLWVERRVHAPIVQLGLFRNRVLAIGCALSALTGVGMFGVIMFSPLLLQAGLGATPTRSGLLMLPLMGAFVGANVTCGRLITRWGRYKPFPIAGTLTIAAGLAWLSTLDTASSLAEASTALGVVGLGLGLIVQVVLIAVQNAVRPADLGSATSLVQFFRTVGGTVGITCYGALLAMHVARSSVEGLDGAGVAELLHSPAGLAQLSAPLREAVQATLAGGITTLFGLTIPVMLCGFVLALLLPQLPLDER